MTDPPDTDAWEAYAALQRRVRAAVEHHVVEILGLHAAPPATQPLGTLGLDSVGALALRDRLQQTLHLKLSATVVLDHPSIRALTTFLVARLSGGEEAPPPTDGAT